MEVSWPQKDEVFFLTLLELPPMCGLFQYVVDGLCDRESVFKVSFLC
jgi:hypothetical protein